MQKQLRKRYMSQIMIIFMAIMVVLVAVINIVYFVHLRSVQDRDIDHISDYYLNAERVKPAIMKPIDSMPWAGGAEEEFMMHFFVVRCDENGNAEFFGIDYIDSIDEETAAKYAEDVIALGQERGNYEDYRYKINKDGKDSVVVFLNVMIGKKVQHDLFIISILIGAIATGVFFVLVLLMSSRVLKPFIRNIEVQKRFITDASHELKTPITSIIASADIIEMEYGENRWVDNIQKQSKRLTNLTNEMVELSRFDEGVLDNDKELFSLTDAAWETAEMFSFSTKTKKIHYIKEIENELTMTGNRDAIQRMLSILLDNAVKYTPEGGTIALRVYKKYFKNVIEMENTYDSEIAIDFDRIFDRFYRPDSSRTANAGGAGIGLSIAQSIAEAHNGKINAFSEYNNTIMFIVRL